MAHARSANCAKETLTAHTGNGGVYDCTSASNFPNSQALEDALVNGEHYPYTAYFSDGVTTGFEHGLGIWDSTLKTMTVIAADVLASSSGVGTLVPWASGDKVIEITATKEQLEHSPLKDDLDAAGFAITGLNSLDLSLPLTDTTPPQSMLNAVADRVWTISANGTRMPAMVNMGGTHTVSTSGGVFGMGALFSAGAAGSALVIKNEDGTALNFGSFPALYSTTVFEADNAAVTFGALAEQSDILLAGTMRRNVSGGNTGTLVAGQWNQIALGGIVGLGATVNLKVGAQAVVTSAAGSLGTSVGFWAHDDLEGDASVGFVLGGIKTAGAVSLKALTSDYALYQLSTAPSRFNGEITNTDLAGAGNKLLAADSTGKIYRTATNA